MRGFFLLMLFSLTTVLLFSKNEPAKVLSYKTRTVFNGNKINTNIEFSIQINSRTGLDYCKVEIPFSGIKEVKNIKASLSDLNGKVLKKLKKKDITISSNISTGSFYQDSFVYYFSLMPEDFPVIFNYSYEESSKQYLHIESWSPYSSQNLEVDKASLEVQLPKDAKFHFKLIEFDSVQPTLLNDYYTYKWQVENFDPISQESFMPSLRKVIPSVIISPYNFFFHHEGSFESWEKYGEWESKMLIGLNDLPDKEKEEIDKAIKDVSTDLEKIEILYKRLQEETRYINISEDVGGMKPHSASYVAENKFGDCKALSNYFKAVLDYAGIESYYTNIYSDRKINPIDIGFPSQQFNHVILIVPMENDSLWIDCTSDLECGYVGTWIQNRNAFIIDGAKSFFKKTPALEKEDVELSRNIYLKISLSKNAKIKVRNQYRGRLYEKLFYIKEQYSQDHKIEVLNKYLLEDHVEVPEQIIMQMSYDPPQMILDYTTNSNTIVQEMGNDIVVNIPELDFPSLERPKYRDYDVQISYPIYYTDQITFEKPINKEINFLPKDQKIESEFGYYSLEVIEKENQININKSFYVNPGYYPISQYEDLYNFIKEARKLDHKLMITTTK